jgi:hypothetical protein
MNFKTVYTRILFITKFAYCTHFILYQEKNYFSRKKYGKSRKKYGKPENIMENPEKNMENQKILWKKYQKKYKFS